jgi:DHA1 family tetracycline resistance protein-like MFS transporter
MPGKTRGPMLVAFVTVAIDLLGFGLVLPLLPVYADRIFPLFDTLTRNVLIGVLMASFSTMQFLFAPLWGRLSDRIGRRPVLLIGLLGSVVFYSLFALASAWKSVVLLFVARIGAGICGATIGTAQAVIADCTPSEQRAAGMALVGMAFGIGFTIGPVLGAISLAREGDEPSVVPGLLAAMLSFAALLLAWFLLPETRREGVSAARSWWPAEGWRIALSRQTTALPIAVFFLVTLAFASFESILARYAQDEIFADTHTATGPVLLGVSLTSRQTRICLLFAYVGVILMLVQGLIVRPLVSRIGEVTMVRAGIGLLITALLIMVWWQAGTSLVITLLALALAVSGFAFCTPSLQSLVSRNAPADRQGQILGVNQSAASLSRILGPVLGNSLYGPKHGSHQLPYYAAAALLLLALLLSLTMRSTLAAELPDKPTVGG